MDMETNREVDDFLRPFPPENTSAAEFLLNRAKSFGERTALIDDGTSESWSYAELVAACHRAAGGLAERGVCSGDTVLLYLPNCLEYVTTFFGSLLCGASVAGIISQSVLATFSQMIQSVKPKVIVTLDQQLEFVKEASEACDGLKEIIVVGTPPSECHTTTFEALLTSSPLHQAASVRSGDVAVYTFTSGSTGRNKVVMTSHRSLIANAIQQSCNELRLFEEAQDVCLMCHPCTHAYGCAVHLVGAIYQGVTHVYRRAKASLSQETITQWLEQIDKYKVTSLVVTPAGIINLLNHPRLGQFNLTSLSDVITAGAPLLPAVVDKLRASISSIQSLRNVYGMSECLVVTSDERNKVSSGVGRLLPGFKGKIVDTESGETLGAGAQGELLLQSPSVCLGYKDNEQDTASAFTDGWFRTGDLAYFDETGILYIVDRLKDIIKYDAVPVAPGFAEGILLEHPAVAEVAVVGKPDPVYGQLPCAFVVAKDGATLVEEDLIALVKERAPNKSTWLRGGVVILDTLPKLPSGKVAKKDLRARLGHQQPSS